MIEEFKKAMMEYVMTVFDLMTYFLSIQAKQLKEKICISQKKYIKELLKKFHISNCKPTITS